MAHWKSIYLFDLEKNYIFLIQNFYFIIDYFLVIFLFSMFNLLILSLLSL